jgi:hypothetical protein
MLAGALVSRVFHFFVGKQGSFASQAGISEHAVMYPVDSIKVSLCSKKSAGLSFMLVGRHGCKFFLRLPWPSTVELAMHSLASPQPKAYVRCGAVSRRLY